MKPIYNFLKGILILVFIFNFPHCQSFENGSVSEIKVQVETKNSNTNLNTNTNLTNEKSENSNLNSNLHQLKSETNNVSNLNGKIFIKQPALKIKTLSRVESTRHEVVVNPKVTINDSANVDNKFAMSTNLLDFSGLNPNDSQLNVGKGPIYMELWVKYFKYSDLDILKETPKKFYKNNEFAHQMKLFPVANLNQKDPDGQNSYIKDQAYFYLILFSNTLNFVTSRQRQLQKTYDSLNLNYIAPVMDTPDFNMGGLLDFGNFEEGYCFKIVQNTPKEVNWILCTETEEEKIKLMNMIKKLKLKLQLDAGIVMLPDNSDQRKLTLTEVLNPTPREGESQNLKIDNKGNLGVVFNSNQKITDGYWIILQDWTECSLKCGGGTNTLQRLCVPPKNGGAPCEGPSILTKKCNTQPCPGIIETGPKNNTLTLKPIVKVMPFSSRPQRYTKCVIKESDLMYTHSPNPNAQPFIATDVQAFQIPTRVVMNNQTVTIFEGEEYKTLIMVFNLADTQLARSLKKKNCFILYENDHKQAELCPFGCEDNNKAVEEWDYDFNLFKYQCHTPKDVINLAGIDDKLKEKIRIAEKEVLEEREIEMKNKAEEKEERQFEGIIKNTNKIALQAIQKEIKLEELLKQEELEKEKRIENEIRIRIEEEKKKSDCILKAIKEKQIENQYNLRAKLTVDHIVDIKKNAIQQVLIRRNKLKSTIDNMRKRSRIRQSRLQQELHDVRLNVAGEMNKAYKKGDIKKCVLALKTEQDKKDYCNANFSEDFTNLNLCQDSEDFCIYCCENEFGDINISERQKCYSAVCDVKSDPQLNGRWMWQNAIQ